MEVEVTQKCGDKSAIFILNCNSEFVKKAQISYRIKRNDF